MERSIALVLALVVLLATARARTYERCELARELVTRHGVPLAQVPTWVCIAYHESRLDTTARNYASGDHGLLQISELFWCERGRPGKACDLSCEALVDDDIADDVRCARAIHEEHTRISGDGFTAWVVYPLHCKGTRAKKYIAECADEIGKWRPTPRSKSLLHATPRPRQKFTYYPDIDKLKPITRGPWQEPSKYHPYVPLNELVPHKTDITFEYVTTVGNDFPLETSRAIETEVGSGRITPSSAFATSTSRFSPNYTTEMPSVRLSSTTESMTSSSATKSIPKSASSALPTSQPWWATQSGSQVSQSSNAPRSTSASGSASSAGSTQTTSPPWWATRASSSWRTTQATSRPPVSFGPSTTRQYVTYSKTATRGSVGSIFDLYLKPKKLQHTSNQNSTEYSFNSKYSSTFKFPKPNSFINWNPRSLSDAKVGNVLKTTALGNGGGSSDTDNKSFSPQDTSHSKKTTGAFKFDWSPFLSTKQDNVSIKKSYPYSSQETVTRSTSNKYSPSKGFNLNSPFFDLSRSAELRKGSTLHIKSASTFQPVVSYTLRPLSSRAAPTLAATATTSRPSITFDAHNIFRYT